MKRIEAIKKLKELKGNAHEDGNFKLFIELAQEMADDEIQAYRTTLGVMPKHGYNQSIFTYCMEQAYVFIGERLGGQVDGEDIDDLWCIFPSSGSIEVLRKLSLAGEFLYKAALALMNSDDVAVQNDEAVFDFIMGWLDSDHDFVSDEVLGNRLVPGMIECFPGGFGFNLEDGYITASFTTWIDEQGRFGRKDAPDDQPALHADFHPETGKLTAYLVRTITKNCMVVGTEKVADIENLLPSERDALISAMNGVCDKDLQHDWIVASARTERFFNLILCDGHGDEDNEVNTIYSFKGKDITPDAFKRSVKRAAQAFLLTEEGQQVLAKQNGIFNWGDAGVCVPANFYLNEGLIVLPASSVDVAVSHDESLNDEELLDLRVSGFVSKCKALSPSDHCVISDGKNHVSVFKSAEQQSHYDILLSQDGRFDEEQGYHPGIHEDGLSSHIILLLGAEAGFRLDASSGEHEISTDEQITLSVDTETKEGKRVSIAFAVKTSFLEGYLTTEGEGVLLTDFVEDHSNDEAENVYAAALASGAILAIEHRFVGLATFIEECHSLPLEGCCVITNGINRVHVQKDSEHNCLYDVVLTQNGVGNEEKGDHMGIHKDDLHRLVYSLLITTDSFQIDAKTIDDEPMTTLSVDTETEDGKRICFVFTVKTSFLEEYLATEGEGVLAEDFVEDHANDEAEDVYAAALAAGEVLAIKHRYTGSQIDAKTIGDTENVLFYVEFDNGDSSCYQGTRIPTLEEANVFCKEHIDSDEDWNHVVYVSAIDRTSAEGLWDMPATLADASWPVFEPTFDEVLDNLPDVTVETTSDDASGDHTEKTLYIATCTYDRQLEILGVRGTHDEAFKLIRADVKKCMDYDDEELDTIIKRCDASTDDGANDLILTSNGSGYITKHGNDIDWEIREETIWLDSDGDVITGQNEQ
jgi:hypothetical protein